MRKAAATAVLLAVTFTPTLALARRVIVEEGTRWAGLQGVVAFLALFPVVAVAVLEMAQWARWRN